jgi:hypothetical protein
VGIFTHRFAGFAKVESRCAQSFDDVGIATQGARHQATRLLAQVIFFRAKPAFKQVLVLTLKIKNFHAVIIALVCAVAVDATNIPKSISPKRKEWRLKNQVPSICEMALAQRVINPLGKMPKINTRAPLVVSTTRTSVEADTALAVMGSSKYITLTTRR